MIKVYKIGLIGAGQLGSRYLQGLAKINLNLNIEIIEPQESARKIAQKRFEEVNQKKSSKILFINNIDELSDNLDLVVISTNSDVRADIIRELVNTKGINALILEKILFQKINDYDEIDYLLKNKKINTWVNHPLRVSLFYKNVKKLLEEEKCISMNVMGGGWGMACNSLHYIDAFAFITGNNKLSISIANLSKTIIDSKRTGYKEVTGLLCGQLGHNNFSIHCIDSFSPITISIYSNSIAFRIDESTGNYEVYENKNSKWRRNRENIIQFQSDITSSLVADILINGKCDLPTYSEAKELHVPFVSAVLKHINNNSAIIYEACPIT